MDWANCGSMRVIPFASILMSLPPGSSVGTCGRSPRPPSTLKETLQISSPPWIEGPTPLDVDAHLTYLGHAVLFFVSFPPPTGKAYSLGRAEYGRLGLGEGAEEKSVPTLISRLPTVSSVACGASVGYAVTKDGEWDHPQSVWLGSGGHDSYHSA